MAGRNDRTHNSRCKERDPHTQSPLGGRHLVSGMCDLEGLHLLMTSSGSHPEDAGLGCALCRAVVSFCSRALRAAGDEVSLGVPLSWRWAVRGLQAAPAPWQHGDPCSTCEPQLPALPIAGSHINSGFPASFEKEGDLATEGPSPHMSEINKSGNKCLLKTRHLLLISSSSHHSPPHPGYTWPPWPDVSDCWARGQ